MDANTTYAPLLHLLILALTPVIIALHHAALARLNRRFCARYSNQSVCLASIAAASVYETLLLFYFGLLGVDDGTVVPTLLYSVIVYLALGYSYFHLFNMSETARRIRLLYDIDRSGNVGFNAKACGTEAGKSISTRLLRLQSIGQVALLKNGRYVTSGSVMLFGARIVRIWGLVLGIDILANR